jgi:hypothetical protein
MSKGGGGTQQVTSTSNTSNIPEYAAPYFTDLMQRAQATVGQQYQPYTGQQVANFTPLQNQAQAGVAGLTTPSQFASASTMAQNAGNAAANIGSTYNPSQFNAQTVTNPNLTNYQAAGPQQFDQSAVQQYMSPYMQNVMDVQTKEALRNAQINNLKGNLGQAASGSYGGSASALMNAENNRNLQTQLNTIQATGLQSAYTNAQDEFNKQNALQQQNALANLQANLGVQQLGSGQNMQAQLANQASGLQAQQYGEQAKQFGANLGLQGLTLANQSAYNLGALGGQQNATNLANLNAQTQAGSQQQAQNQQVLNQQYLNFAQQRDYPMQMLSYYSGLLHGLPVTPNTVSTAYMAAPSGLSQLAGAGLGAASIAKLAGG